MNKNCSVLNNFVSICQLSTKSCKFSVKIKKSDCVWGWVVGRGIRVWTVITFWDFQEKYELNSSVHTPSPGALCFQIGACSGATHKFRHSWHTPFSTESCPPCAPLPPVCHATFKTFFQCILGPRCHHFRSWLIPSGNRGFSPPKLKSTQCARWFKRVVQSSFAC